MTNPSNLPAATVALFRRSLDGFRWCGSYTSLDNAYDAAGEMPGIYQLREVPTGKLIDALNTYDHAKRDGRVVFPRPGLGKVIDWDASDEEPRGEVARHKPGSI